MSGRCHGYFCKTATDNLPCLNVTVNIRLPAEWEPQSAIMLTWPHSAMDWQTWLNEVDPVYIEITSKANFRVMILTVILIRWYGLLTMKLSCMSPVMIRTIRILHHSN